MNKKRIVCLIIALIMVSATFSVDALVPVESDKETVRTYALMGDADNNERVNIKDATLIQKHVADITYIDDSVIFFADVDGDKSITVKDATAIQLALADLGGFNGIGYQATSKTNRYYFYMPESWLNDYSADTGNTAGIYWWDGTHAHNSWPGIPAKKGDAEGVYYCDVPIDVSTIIWNNYVDGGFDRNEDIFYSAFQTCNIPTEWYDPGESNLYPEGTDDFDGMIYVIDSVYDDWGVLEPKYQARGEWFYYYGNGEYGIAPVRGDSEILTGEYVELDALLDDRNP